jgi:calcineurin-like phosphoesterase family protein
MRRGWCAGLNVAHLKPQASKNGGWNWNSHYAESCKRKEKLFDFVTSDLHLFHKNIVQYAGRPENHTELIIENWQNTVDENATVLCLGDVLMGKRDLWPSIIGQLPGGVFVLDSGNHDESHKRRFLEEKLGWKFIPEFQIFYEGYVVFFTHYPKGAVLDEDAKRNTDMHIQDMLLPRILNVHGHIHERAMASPQYINCCVEQTNYSPVNLEELLEERINLLEKK